MHENIFSLVLLIWLKIDLIDSESRIRARGVEENEVKCFKFVRVCVLVTINLNLVKES